MKPKVSIVTVAYNAAACIGQTIESVLEQNCNDFEYVFVDGNSKDTTVQIIESYRPAFEARGVHYSVVSEPDKGIYDAMNKGVRRSRGEYVLMMNAGDRFVDASSLEALFAREQTADVLYADAVLQDVPYYKISRAGSPEQITRGMPFCHQCVLVKQSVLAEYGFDTRYKLAADYDQLLRCYLDKRTFAYVPVLLSVYDVSGVSERNFKKSLTEQKAVRLAHGLTGGKPIAYELLLRQRAKLIKRFLPKLSRGEKRGWFTDLEQVKRGY